ncbi:MAG: Hint domain-containing protein [Myxococcota bacterium]
MNRLRVRPLRARLQLAAFGLASVTACAQILGFEDDPQLGSGAGTGGIGGAQTNGGKHAKGGSSEVGGIGNDAGALGTGGTASAGTASGGASGASAGQAGATAGGEATGGEAGASGATALGGRGSGGANAAGGKAQGGAGGLSQGGGQAGVQGAAGTSGGVGAGGAPGAGGITGAGGDVLGSGGAPKGGASSSLGGKIIVGRGGFLNTGDTGSGDVGSCFVADTKVTMADGSERRIDSIRIGDQVLSFDETTRSLTLGTVTETFVHPRTPLLVLVDGSLLTTPEHRFYVDGAWKQARRLAPGIDVLLHLDTQATALNAAPLLSISSRPGDVTTYNLEVEPAHTYFAGKVLVHNLKPQEP